MLSNTRGIVLHTTKFGENSLIITLYTRNFGRESCIVNATGGIRSKNKAALMQPLYILDLEIYRHKNRELQRVRESRLCEPYLSIPFDVYKSCQAIFLSEILFRILQEEESNTALYDFMESALVYFDLMKEGSASFHLWFLARLTEYLGIFPHLGSEKEGWFDLKKGVIAGQVPDHPFFMEQDTTGLFIQILSLNINDLANFRTTHNQRNDLLIKLLDYFQLHFDTLGNIHSLAVLKEVFD